MQVFLLRGQPKYWDDMNGSGQFSRAELKDRINIFQLHNGPLP